MKSIFEYKQYDLIFDDGGYMPATLIQRTIDGLDWNIFPIVNHGQDYHTRDFDLSLLEDIVDTENYRFTLYKNKGVYSYESGIATVSKPRVLRGYIKTDMEISFDDFCELIKNDDV